MENKNITPLSLNNIFTGSYEKKRRGTGSISIYTEYRKVQRKINCGKNYPIIIRFKSSIVRSLSNAAVEVPRNC